MEDCEHETIYLQSAFASSLICHRVRNRAGRLPLVRTDRQAHSFCDKNFTLINTIQQNQSNPKQHARRSWFSHKLRSWKKFISKKHKKSFKKAYFEMTVRATVQPATSDLRKAPKEWRFLRLKLA